MRAHIRGNDKPVSRISMSLPETLLCDLDRMVEERGFDSRSQAIADMLYQSLVEHKSDVGQDVMVGVVTLFYDNSVAGLQKQLADLQFRHILATGQFDPASGRDDIFDIHSRTASGATQGCAVRNISTPITGIASSGNRGRRHCAHLRL